LAVAHTHGACVRWGRWVLLTVCVLAGATVGCGEDIDTEAIESRNPLGPRFGAG
jgi:hypothetical protein